MIAALALLPLLAAAPADFPAEQVAEEFAAICLSQPAGYPDTEAIARSRGWSERMPGNPTPMLAGSLAAPTLPWRRVSFGRATRWGGNERGCMIELEAASCEEIAALAAAVATRIGRGSDAWDAGRCAAIWRSPDRDRVIEVGHNGHGLVRLFALDRVIWSGLE